MVVVLVNINIILIEITFEIMPVGHLLEFLLVGKESRDCALVLFVCFFCFFVCLFVLLGRSLCI